MGRKHFTSPPGLNRDWFIETCQDWAIPYLGDLVGYRLLPGVDASNPNPALVSPRADVANTIGYRRRKGTLALLERLAADIARWPARAVELRQLVGSTETVRRFSGDATANAARLAAGGYVRTCATVTRSNGSTGHSTS